MEKFVERLQSLFGGLDRAFGRYNIDEENLSGGDGKKQGGKAVTLAEKPTAQHWIDHLEGKAGFGVIPIRDDGTVVWACIDIDAYGKDVLKLVHKFIQEYGLPFVVCRSKSGGAHVFIFFREPVKATGVVKKLAAFAAAMGFKGAEVFPKQIELQPDQFGNWLNMPYFDHEISVRYGLDDQGKRLDLEGFLDYAEAHRVSPAAWKALEVPTLEHPFEDGPPCIQTLAREKVSEGGRNDALLQMGVYAKNKYGEDYPDKVIEYNSRFFTEPLAYREIQATVLKSLERRDYGYKCDVPPFDRVCNRQACLRRKFGIGGAADEAFEQQIELHNLKQLIFFAPDGSRLTDESEWELTVCGKVMRFRSTDELLNQRILRVKCAEQLNILPPPLPAARWSQILSEHMASCDTIEIPFEVSPAGQTFEMLRKYIRVNNLGTTNADLLSNVAVKVEDQFRFRIEGLQEQMNDAGFKLKIKTLAEHLEIIGCERRETTIRDGARTRKVAYWQVKESILELIDSEDDPVLDKPDDTEPAF